MLRCVLWAMTGVVLALIPAVSVAEEPGRYAMTPVDDGVLRLDTSTGAVSICRPQDNEWGCALVHDAHAGLQRELEALKQQKLALQSELEALKSAQAKTPDNPADKKQDRILTERERQALTDKTVDQMMSVLEKMMKRFEGMIDSLRAPPEGKQL